jgi:hypothetical protein
VWAQVLLISLVLGTGALPAAAADDPFAVLAIRDPRIGESSGLAASGRHRGVLWTINDSGDAARIYAIGPDGRTRATLRLAGLEPRDWEAVAPGRDAEGRAVLWVGDIGDNSARRDRGILVHRVTEPATLRDATVRATSYRLRYPDRPHDAEALLIEPGTGRVLVVTKELFGGGVYAAPARLDATRPNLLERVADAPPMVTDGAYVPDGRLVLRTYSPAHVYARLGGDGVAVELPEQPQGESLAADPSAEAVLVGSEGRESVVWRVRLPTTPRPAARPTSRPEHAGVAASPAGPPRARWALPAAAAVVLAGLAVTVRLRRRVRRR